MTTISKSESIPLLPEHLDSNTDDEVFSNEPIWPGMYKKLESLGTGGCAEVYKAVHRASGLEVAVKLSRTGSDYLKRFDREVEVLRKIQHTNVVEIHDAGFGWYAMQLATGSLTSLAPELGDEERLEMVEQVTAGLMAVHREAGPHRDVTPNNILRMPDRRWVLADFGLVRRQPGESSLPHTRGALGTLGFIAPEITILGGHIADHRADIYSLGRTLAYMCSGRWPRGEETLPLPPLWLALISRMTARALDERFQTVDEIQSALVDVRARLRLKRRSEWSQLPNVEEGLIEHELVALRRILKHTTDTFRENDVFGAVADGSRMSVNIGLLGLRRRKFVQDAENDHGEVWALRLTSAAQDWLFANIAALELGADSSEEVRGEPPPSDDGAPF